MKEQKKEMNGKCSFCNNIFSKSVMTRHLMGCKERKEVPISPVYSLKGTVKDRRVFHILVEGRYKPEYWMHLDIAADITLKQIDKFLRNIWLECCGHLSSFHINDIEYHDVNDDMSDEPWPDLFGRRPKPRSTDIRIGAVLSPHQKFSYEYDFGSTTHLTLKVLSVYEKDIKYKFIEILARNLPPNIVCEVCGKPATFVCGECFYMDKGWLCDKCAEEHPCGEEMLLPVVNSPRVGVCAYGR
jgi:hypothetical protein